MFNNNNLSNVVCVCMCVCLRLNIYIQLHLSHVELDFEDYLIICLVWKTFLQYKVYF